MGEKIVRVLVVDDVEDLAEMVAEHLRLDGFAVATAFDADQAVRAIEERQPDCVLLDVGMPGIDGYELASLLRHRFREKIVLIAVTGLDRSHPRVAAVLPVVDDFFQKPVDHDKLLQALRP